MFYGGNYKRKCWDAGDVTLLSPKKKKKKPRNLLSATSNSKGKGGGKRQTCSQSAHKQNYLKTARGVPFGNGALTALDGRRLLREPPHQEFSS